MSQAFWYCSCRHPGTKVYYADEMGKKQQLYDELRGLFEEMREQRDQWKQLYADARSGPLTTMTPTTVSNQTVCANCGKRKFGLSIPRLGIQELGDFCMCVSAASQLQRRGGENG